MEVLLSVAGLVLAAGRGRRIGGPKALLRHGDALLVEHAVRAVRDVCDRAVVVLGAAADQVRASADLAGAAVVVNPAWGTGVGSSLRAGLSWAADSDVEAAVVVLVDMPGITAEAVRRVADAPEPAALVCATFAGRRTHPMLLGRAHWPGIATLANGDVGVRPYLLARSSQVKEIPCDEVAAPGDVDTPEDAARWGIVVDARATN